jgi:hypothetical protein
VWATRSPGAVVSAACEQRWSSSSPTGGDDGVQEGGVQTASGCSAAPPPTSGCKAPPPLSGGRRQLQAAVHVAATLAGGQRWSERAVAQAGGQHGHSGTGRRATARAGGQRGNDDGWTDNVVAVYGAGVQGLLKVLGARAHSLLDRIQLIYNG